MRELPVKYPPPHIFAPKTFSRVFFLYTARSNKLQTEANSPVNFKMLLFIYFINRCHMCICFISITRSRVCIALIANCATVKNHVVG